MKRSKILIVEDNDHFRQALMGVLLARFPSLRIEEAQDGEEALAKTEAFDPDLIFMDIKLPGESGLVITEKIRFSNSRVKIIILTSYDSPEYREAAWSCGADHFFSKDGSSAGDILFLVGSVLAL